LKRLLLLSMLQGGQAQSFTLAVSLALQPKVLLLDEPAT
jgi:ABC-type sulfate/molybdate transport systems ATPase subunit